jgi:hypothetical protein
MSAMERAAFISDAHPDLSRLPASPGPYAVLKPEEYVVQIQDHPHQVKAHAINIFSMDLRRWAIDTDPAHDAEVADMAKTMWSLDCAHAGKCAFSPIPIAVSDFLAPGGPGSLQKIGLDKLVYSFFWAWYEWYQAAPSHDATPTDKDFMLETFQKMALHTPADFHYFAPGANLSKEIFVWQVNFMEGFRKDEERHATGGWQAACVSAKARCLALAQGADVSAPSDATKEILEGVTWATTSNFKVTAGADSTLEKRKVADILRCYDRAMEFSLGPLLSRTRVEFPKGILDLTSKLILISQKTAGLKCDKCGHSAFPFVVETAFLRMKVGVLCPESSYRSLLRDTIPRLVSVFKVVHAACHKFETELCTHSTQCERTGDEQQDDKERASQAVAATVHIFSPMMHELFLSATSVRARAELSTSYDKVTSTFIAWCSDFYEGKFEHAHNEMDEDNGRPLVTGHEILDTDRFALKAQVFQPIAVAREQLGCTRARKREEEAKVATSLPAPVTAPSLDPEATPDSFKEMFDAITLTAADSKEVIIEAEQRAHVSWFLSTQIHFVKTPSNKDGFKLLFTEGAICKNRLKINETNLSDARHALIYDANSDQICLRSDRFPPMDEALVKLVIETFLANCTLKSDSVLIPSAQSKYNASKAREYITKSTKGMETDSVTVLYRQDNGVLKKLLEPIDCWARESYGRAADKPRTFNQITTMDTDVIAMVRAPDNTAPSLCVTLTAKLELFAAEKITVAERAKDPSELVPLFNREKNWETIVDILEHFGITTATLVSAGNGNWLRGFLYLGIKAVVCVRTDSCEDRLRNFCVNLLLQTVNDPTKPHHLSRSFIIDNKGLEADVNMATESLTAPSLSKACDAGPDDAVAEEEDEGEEEDEEEEGGGGAGEICEESEEDGEEEEKKRTTKKKDEKEEAEPAKAAKKRTRKPKADEGVSGGKDGAGSGTQPATAPKKKTRKLGRLREAAKAAKKGMTAGEFSAEPPKKRKKASADATAAIM